MSIYSTSDISREEAERLVLECRAKNYRSVRRLSNEELDRELHQYVYERSEGRSGLYDDILPWGVNYTIH